MCQFLCRDKHIELGGQVKVRQKGRGREGGWKEDGSDSCKVSGGPDIPCLPSHARHTGTNGSSKASAE